MPGGYGWQRLVVACLSLRRLQASYAVVSAVLRPAGRAARAGYFGALDAARELNRGRAGPRLVRVGSPVADLPSGLCWSACYADSVRGCPCDPAAGSPRARTHSGQRRRAGCNVTSFTQVNDHVEVRAGTFCKPSAQPTLVRTQHLSPPGTPAQGRYGVPDSYPGYAAKCQQRRPDAAGREIYAGSIPSK
jgi:hypothetical protein